MISRRVTMISRATLLEITRWRVHRFIAVHDMSLDLSAGGTRWLALRYGKW